MGKTKRGEEKAAAKAAKAKAKATRRAKCAIALACALALACAGCVYRGAKLTEGTDLTLGVSIPGTEGMAEAAVVNWLSGFRLAIAEGAELDVKYTVAETNDYLGCITTRTYKHIEAQVTPVDFGGSDTNAVAEARAKEGAEK